MRDEVASMCRKCGASVYRQHIDSGIARYEDGKLLCAVCVEEYEQAHDETLSKSGSHELTPIELEEDAKAPVADSSKSRMFVHKTALGTGDHREHAFTRPMNSPELGATRCRTFHAKLNEPALEFMNNQVNSWIDGDTTVSIKFATSTIGVFEAKHPEPHLILTVFY